MLPARREECDIRVIGTVGTSFGKGGISWCWIAEGMIEGWNGDETAMSGADDGLLMIEEGLIYSRTMR